MSIKKNIAIIYEQMERSAAPWGRSSSNINLVAVSKRQSQDKITEALNAGHRLFGENRVQEAQDHWAELKPQYPDIKLHLIGPLQTNKVKDALALFDMIETLDREKLAKKISNEMHDQVRNIPCLIQINTGEEPQKAGIAPKDLPDFLKFCRYECALDIRGLMCIPPIDAPVAIHFALLNKLAKDNKLNDLSMGMSGDFEKAIPLGANYIRIGTAIFGKREAITA